MRNLLRLVALCIAWVCLLLSASAHADLAPDPAWRRISYSFSIENADAFSDYVFLAYPCSTTNGRPMFSVAVVKADPVAVGTRGGMPRIYAVPRAEYDRSKESIAGDNVKASEIKAIPGVLESNFRVQPMHGVGEDQPIDSAHDVLRVVKCDKSGLEVTASRVRYHTLKGRTIELAYGSGGQRPSVAQVLAKGTAPAQSDAPSATASSAAPPDAIPSPAASPSASPTPAAPASAVAVTTTPQASRGCGGCGLDGRQPRQGAITMIAAFACLLRRRARERLRSPDRARG